jgi:hypothetical protein
MIVGVPPRRFQFAEKFHGFPVLHFGEDVLNRILSGYCFPSGHTVCIVAVSWLPCLDLTQIYGPNTLIKKPKRLFI